MYRASFSGTGSDEPAAEEEPGSKIGRQEPGSSSSSDLWGESDSPNSSHSGLSRRVGSGESSEEIEVSLRSSSERMRM